jgi:hypothetical protein
MKVEFDTPTVPNFILGKAGTTEVKLPVNEMDKEDLEELIRRWENEVWLKYHKPKINVR